MVSWEMSETIPNISLHSASYSYLYLYLFLYLYIAHLNYISLFAEILLNQEKAELREN